MSRMVEWKRDGVMREVFLVGRWAIKLPKLTRGWRNFLRGLLANIHERELSTLRWRTLCPIVFSVPGGWLNVMQRATPLTDDELAHFDIGGFFYPENGEVIPGEPKGSSIGWLDGRIVAVDYVRACVLQF
jgi:hypothetical protein